MTFVIGLAEKRLVPDTLIRTGIRSLLRERLAELKVEDRNVESWRDQLADGPIAVSMDAANDQHYELPATYFQTVLGKHLKYSCGFWEGGQSTLDESETAMLALTCDRAELSEGQQILELGCGWGSLSLFMAERYPGSHITSVSNSQSQRRFILEQARLRGLENLHVLTADINEFQPEGRYDRVVSVEMFEHVRNHAALGRRIRGWLTEEGKLFVHIFTHRSHTYLFEPNGPKDWMSRYFFTGGIMPAADLLPTVMAESLTEANRWKLNGVNYSRTLEAWLAKQDRNEAEVRSTFKACYGSKDARLWMQRWRMFYMACSELFAYNNGNEWPVTHYLFQRS